MTFCYTFEQNKLTLFPGFNDRVGRNKFTVAEPWDLCATKYFNNNAVSR